MSEQDYGPDDRGVDYGFDRLERVTVRVPKRHAHNAIADVARQMVKDDGELSVDGWGNGVHRKEWHDGVGVRSKEWYEVTFRRTVPEQEAQDEQ